MNTKHLLLMVFLSIFAWNANAQITSFPFTEGFEGTTFPPTGWTQNQLSGTTNWSTKDGNNNFGSVSSSQAGSLNAYFYTSSRGNSAQLVTPAMDISTITNPQLVFWHTQEDWSGDQDELEVFYKTSASGTWTLLTSYTNSIDTWTERVINLPNASSDYYIAFEATSDYGYGVTIDEFKVDAAPSCLSPNMLAASNLLATSANLGWTDANSSASWQVEWGTTGFTQGSGTLVTSSSNSYTLNSLTAETSYQYYVRAICGAGDTSSWSAAGSFTTPCAAVTAPYTMDFNASTTSTPNCWNQMGSESWLFRNSGTGHIGSVGTLNGTTPSGGYFAWVDDSGPHNTGTTLESPLIDVSSLTSPLLTFYTISDNEGETNVDFHVDVYDGANWNDSIYFSDNNTVNEAWEEILVPLSNLTITGPIKVRFVVDENNGTDFDDDRAIDDISITEAPSCLRPLSTSFGNLTDSSVVLTWNDFNSATSWQIEYGTTGFTQGSGNLALVSTNPFTLNGLSAQTSYDVYIRTICGAGDTSVWAAFGNVTTPCQGFTIPYFEGFEFNQTHNTAIGGCVSQESVTGGQSWAANNTFTDRNRTPRTGSWNAFLQYGNDDWMFIPVTLVGGTTYTAEVYARQDGTGTTNADVGISYGTADNAAAMTNTIVANTGLDDNHQMIRGAFTPATSGTYYVGVNGYMNFTPWHISIDDLSIVVCNPTSSTDTRVACDEFTWTNGVTYTASNNTATDTFVNAAGCDSVVTLDLTINNSNTGPDDIIASCASYYTWTNGVTYTTDNNTATDTFTNAAGCDSVVTLDLTITTPGTIDTYSDCISYTWTDGVTYTASNTTATDTFTNAAGCDSVVTLNLTIGNDASTDVRTACESLTWTNGVTYTADNFTAQDTFTNIGGCDSIVTLNFTVLESEGTDEITACDTFTWRNGVFYTASNNTDTIMLTNSFGCDSVLTLDLTILNSSNPTFEVATACGSYTWNGTTYTASNFIDEVTLTNAAGCDSTVRLNLTILPESATTDVVNECGSFYTWIDGNTYTADNNTATITYTNAAGCDSVVTLDLTIGSPATTDVIVACNSYYTWTNGVTYTADNNTATDTFTNAAGCDSVVMLDLTISSPGTVDTRVACDTFTWTNGVLYAASNTTATDTFMNAAGCDSVVTLNLTMNYTSFGVDAITACDSYTWINGVTYTSTNFFDRDTITTAAGCDSIVRLNLTINNSTTTTDVIAECGSYYEWINGVTYFSDNNTATITYTNVSGCDSTINLDLTILSPATTDSIVACDEYTWTNGVTYTANNNTAIDTFTNAAGCDSLVYLNLTIKESTGSTDVQAVCGSLTWLDGNTYTADNNTATFTYTNAVGCDSIVTLNLTILSDSVTDNVTACDSYTWIDGNTYTASNNTATFTYTNSFGCDSVVSLNLVLNNTVRTTEVVSDCDSYTWTNGVTYTTSNNTALDTFVSAAGCDSIVTLDLTLNFSNSSTEVVTACDEYTWNGTTYTASTNTPTATFTNAAGCDSVVTLDLTINNSSASTFTVEACNTYTWTNGVTYTASNNIATQTFTNASGCDSVVTLNLTILESTSGIAVVTACDRYTWIDGVEYTASNSTATTTITNIAGCDSVVTLNLTINESKSSTETIVACDNYTWTNGVTYTASNNTAMDTFQTILGCDSIVTLDLTINNSNSSTQVVNACNNYTWVNGKIYTVSNNTDQFTFTNMNGCDSVVTLDLTVTYRTLGTEVVEACGSYTWNGITYTSDESKATDTLVNSRGCDSIVTLNLTILEPSSSVDAITACGEYTWIDGNTYTESNNTATFTLTNEAGCDSVVSLDLDLTVIDVTVTKTDPTLEAEVQSGATYQWLNCSDDFSRILGATGSSYRAEENSDYAVEISLNGCRDTSDCETVAKASVFESSIFEEVSVYPNPNTGIVNVDLSSLANADITVYDMAGKVIFTQKDVPSSVYQFNLEATPGVYIVEILSDGKTMRSSLVKQ